MNRTTWTEKALQKFRERMDEVVGAAHYRMEVEDATLVVSLFDLYPGGTHVIVALYRAGRDGVSFGLVGDVLLVDERGPWHKGRVDQERSVYTLNIPIGIMPLVDRAYHAAVLATAA